MLFEGRREGIERNAKARRESVEASAMDGEEMYSSEVESGNCERR